MGRSLIRLQSRLPANLWLEFIRAAVYLVNRTPTRSLGWKTPLGVLQECLGGDSRIKLAHLRTIGCKGYAKNYNRKKGDKMEPRAYVGYLIGYESTNIWRVWLPEQKRVLRTRDVVFDESEKYDPAQASLEEKNPELTQAVSSVELPTFTQSPVSSGSDSYAHTFIHQITQGLFDPMLKTMTLGN